MSLLELKGGILEYVVKVQDEEQLRVIYDQLREFVQVDTVEEVTPPHIESELDAAIAEMDDESKWLSHEDAMKQIRSRS